MLNFDEITFNYQNSNENIISKLSFNINKGDFVSIIGASGCGKSTIFRLIASLEKQSSGTIYIGDKDIRELKAPIGYMPQKDLLLPWRTILENTCLPLEIQGVSKNEAKKQAEELLGRFSLYEYKDKYPKDLSGGMKQRISFIRTLLTGSEVLLLDEPFSALDAITRLALQEWLLDQWSKYNKTILFITHDVEEAMFLSNKIFVVNKNPITELKEIEIPLKYPRNRRMLETEELLTLKDSLIDELR
ncbi:ABC transporter ATP-binding protein, partial [Clostridium chauvoei]